MGQVEEDIVIGLGWERWWDAVVISNVFGGERRCDEGCVFDSSERSAIPLFFSHADERRKYCIRSMVDIYLILVLQSGVGSFVFYLKYTLPYCIFPSAEVQLPNPIPRLIRFIRCQSFN